MKSSAPLYLFKGATYLVECGGGGGGGGGGGRGELRSSLLKDV